jgi:putative flippase GtrA
MLPGFRRLLAHVPAGQMVRFIGVGAWNTLFGYASFAVFAHLLEHRFPTYGYIIAGGVSSVVNISIAFLGYKWLVFKTKGNYLREWARCMVVYSSSIVLGMFLLPLLVFVIRHVTTIDKNAPYIAAAVLVCLNALYNFIGNRQFTFSRAVAEGGGGIDS